MRLNINQAVLLTGSALSIALAFAPAAAAQAPIPAPGPSSDTTPSPPDAGPPNDGDDQSDGILEDIVVTAQKRSEKLQDVPITIAAITADTAARLGATTTQDIPALVPGVTISRVTVNPQVFIRGVGSQNVSTGAEGSNPIYLDGFYNPIIGAGLFALNSITRIEVLKGPQGTLFGRNTTGGAVNVITRDPSSQTAVSGSLGYGNYDTIDAAAYATTGSDTVAGDLAVVVHHQGDGFGTNLFNGRDVNRSREFAIRSKLKVEPGNGFKAVLAVDYGRTRASDGLAVRPAPSAFTPVVRETYPGDYYDVRSNIQPFRETKSYGVQLRAEAELSWANFVSMSGYRAATRKSDYDQDGSSFALVNARFHSEEDSFTQELQLQSLAGEKIQWVVGAFYLKWDAYSNPLEITGAAAAAAGGSDARFGRIFTESLAGFAQATVPLGGGTDVTGGIRYTHDHKDLQFVEKFGNGTVLRREDGKSWNSFTWRAALSHKFTDDVMAYGSVSRGFKAGEFAIFTFAAPSVDPEKITAYEVGLKTEFANRRARFNVSGFHYDFTDIQLNQLINAQQFLLNAAKAKVTGVDVEFSAVPVSGLTIGAGLTGLFTHKYTSFPNAPATTPRPITTGGNVNSLIDASGNTMIQSPDLTANLNAAYKVPLAGGGDVTLSSNVVYNDGFFWEPDNRVRQKKYTLVNAQLAWTLANENVKLRLWAKNLTNKKYALYEPTSVADLISPAPPRTYGASVDFSF